MPTLPIITARQVSGSPTVPVRDSIGTVAQQLRGVGSAIEAAAQITVDMVQKHQEQKAETASTRAAFETEEAWQRIQGEEPDSSKWKDLLEKERKGIVDRNRNGLGGTGRGKFDRSMERFKLEMGRQLNSALRADAIDGIRAELEVDEEISLERYVKAESPEKAQDVLAEFLGKVQGVAENGAYSREDAAAIARSAREGWPARRAKATKKAAEQQATDIIFDDPLLDTDALRLEAARALDPAIRDDVVRRVKDRNKELATQQKRAHEQLFNSTYDLALENRLGIDDIPEQITGKDRGTIRKLITDQAEGKDTDPITDRGLWSDLWDEASAADKTVFMDRNLPSLRSKLSRADYKELKLLQDEYRDGTSKETTATRTGDAKWFRDKAARLELQGADEFAPEMIRSLERAFMDAAKALRDEKRRTDPQAELTDSEREQLMDGVLKRREFRLQPASRLDQLLNELPFISIGEEIQPSLMTPEQVKGVLDNPPEEFKQEVFNKLAEEKVEGDPDPTDEQVRAFMRRKLKRLGAPIE